MLAPILHISPEREARECSRQATHYFLDALYWSRAALKSAGDRRRECMRACRLNLVEARARRLEAEALLAKAASAPIELRRAA